MKVLNRQVEYGLMALKYLSSQKQGQRVSVREMETQLKIPFDPLSRVLQKMNKAGWVQSAQGLKGGYLLVVELERLSFLQLSELLSGKLAIVKCFQEEELCSLERTCNVQSSAKVLQNKIREFYKSLTVEEILKPKRGRRERKYG